MCGGLGICVCACVWHQSGWGSAGELAVRDLPASGADAERGARTESPSSSSRVKWLHWWQQSSMTSSLSQLEDRAICSSYATSTDARRWRALHARKKRKAAGGRSDPASLLSGRGNEQAPGAAAASAPGRIAAGCLPLPPHPSAPLPHPGRSGRVLQDAENRVNTVNRVTLQQQLSRFGSSSKLRISARFPNDLEAAKQLKSAAQLNSPAFALSQ